MDSRSKYERRLMYLIFLFCMCLFINLSIKEDPIDKVPLVLGGVLIVLITFGYFVIRKFYPDGDKYLLIFAAVLSIISIAVLYRLNVIKADQGKYLKQLVWFSAGITAYILIVVLIPDLKSFVKYKKVYMIGTVIFMAMPFIPFIGKTVNGSRNWVRIAGFGFQPSEIGKILFVLYLASALCHYEDKGDFIEDTKQLIEPAVIVMICLGLLVLQRDLGSALIFFGISMTVLYISTSKAKYLITCLGLFSAGAYISYKLFAHVRLRILVWRNVWQYAGTKSYQLVQGLYAISSGGILGVGVGNGMPSSVPERSTDYIYSVICEEYGIVFAIGILLVYFLLFYRGMRASLATDDKFSQLAAVGFSTMIVMQVLVIVGGIFTIIPLTGITLPLISYGGTSMLTMFFALGILQKISEEGA
ncbi:MAG: FtsW/RodA/SpoVE family cell cycle protein [Inconstantimicrobium porci]|uniref:FtsW/RodA/SpoVE family cell cycle protein n=1 Tax=Inconstantimicrobium porci TaxID=2652291 RepID=A0A7X2MZ66_9CLOT|nr:FtsW/RodA/SpoVE family cell cycle protein [Inconstantimicrobium porci]MDY5913653.1 FtsW/RodA/SpoVE family cell cycle protein [Inconstantimicrobium porci]MSR91765.1 FtsW/RodA/SpoVE family cell cycle protein [Inconstantimicrobium porci]